LSASPTLPTAPRATRPVASPTAGGPVIQATDLRKQYGELAAVDGVTFEVAAGEIFGLLGPNGAGKTTTVEMLEGLRKPDGGEARVLGLDVSRQAGALKERIGVQLQTAALYPELTVVEVIDLFRSFYRRTLPTDQLIEWLGLGERRTALTKVLSGGQRQRLSVALALVNDPELVFLDEPTTGMDPQARRSLWDLISSLRDRGTSVLLTTHYMDEAEQLCDHIGIMDHGKILEMGTVDELISRRFKERSVRFDAIHALTHDQLAKIAGVSRVVEEDGSVALYTSDVAATIGALLDLAEGLGVEPANLNVRRATLEDVFLDLTGRALRD
jgi:ABC-2 type transport system ATP-binding protein